jgi:transposase-like protein
MAVLIAGKRFWLWQAVDDEGEVSTCWCSGDATRLQL